MIGPSLTSFVIGPSLTSFVIGQKICSSGGGEWADSGRDDDGGQGPRGGD